MDNRHSGHRGRRHALVWITVVLITVLAALPGLLALLPAPLGAQPVLPAVVIEIRQAQFLRLDSTGEEPSLVALPDAWAQRGRPGPGRGRYGATFTLTAPPPAGTTWALRAERLPRHHALQLNGHTVHDTRTVQPEGTRRPLPTLITFSGEVLRPGANTLDLVVEPGERAGLSVLQLGPLADLQPLHQHYLHWHVEVPEGLNAAAAGVAALMVLLWAQRRQEQRVGCFGAIALLACVRNLAYFSATSALPGRWTDLLFFLAQVASAGLFGLFALVQTGRRPRGYLRALIAVVALGLLVGPLAALQQALPLARRWVYPLLLLACVPAVAMLLRHARQPDSGRIALVPLAGWMLVLAAGLHDYLYQTGRLAITHDYALPLAVPLLVLAFAGLQLRRLMRGMNELDRLNTALESRVAERTRELDHAVQARTRFLAAASHDLRQPMAALTLLLGVLREQLPPQPALQALAARLEATARSLGGLLDGLLDLSRLDSGRVRAQPGAVALQPLLRAVAADLDAEALRKGLRLIQHPSAAVVAADPLLLEQIVRNLAGNAVAHTARGGVLIGARPCGAGAVRLVVHDTGPGIAPADRERIFEAFVQLDNPARERRRGIGLGLAIAQRSAGLLGTRLDLVSVVGRGSRFSLVLPRADRPAATAPAPAAADPPASTTTLHGRVIWLLEDDDLLAQALLLRLQTWGARVRHLGTLAALQQALAADHDADDTPDTLLTDLRLPDGDGLAAVAALRQRYPGARALVLTGDTAPEQLARLADSGLPVLHKPCSGEALQAALQAAPWAGT